MAANDGPVPGRTLAHAARLVREAHQLSRYGIAGCEPVLDYAGLLARVSEVVDEIGRQSALRSQLHDAGVAILENAGPASFESACSIAMHYSRDGQAFSATAALAVTALGWVAQTRALNLAAAGVAVGIRGFVQVDQYLRTTAPNIFAAGDVTGKMMLAPQAIQQGFLAATNALTGNGTPIPLGQAAPIGSFTDPEYAQVGLIEERAREAHRIEVAAVPFETATRPIIDGLTAGLCKLIAHRDSGKILGCHVVGERAVDIVQVAAVATAAGMTVQEFARVPLAFPTYAGVLGRAAVMLAQRQQTGRKIDLPQPAF